MNIREITAKNTITKTGIGGYDYCLNPYVGCQHGCKYCYASFMKRFTGHREPWGGFVDIKINAPDSLRRQLRRIKNGTVIVGTVTDPYQPLEKKYRITRDCLKAFAGSLLTVSILTRSGLAARDIDVFKELPDVEVGFSIATNREDIKTVFEPFSPSIRSRLDALKAIHDAGIRTYVFIGPILPMDPRVLAGSLAGIADEVLIDKLNYPGKVAGLIRAKGLTPHMTSDRFRSTARDLSQILAESGIPVTVLFD